jgi:hypothetical protein
MSDPTPLEAARMRLESALLSGDLGDSEDDRTDLRRLLDAEREAREECERLRAVIDANPSKSSNSSEAAPSVTEAEAREPTLASFIGAVPDLTGGLSSQEYIRRIRDRADTDTEETLEEVLRECGRWYNLRERGNGLGWAVTGNFGDTTATGTGPTILAAAQDLRRKLREGA